MVSGSVTHPFCTAPLATTSTISPVLQRSLASDCVLLVDEFAAPVSAQVGGKRDLSVFLEVAREHGLHAFVSLSILFESC